MSLWGSYLIGRCYEVDREIYLGGRYLTIWARNCASVNWVDLFAGSRILWPRCGFAFVLVPVFVGLE